MERLLLKKPDKNLSHPVQSLLWKPSLAHNSVERNFYHKFRTLFTFPSVYASDTEQYENPEEQPSTSQHIAFTDWSTQNPNPYKETGWDRLREMYKVDFKVDKEHQYSPELQLIGSVSLQTMALTFIFGSAVASRATYGEFIEANKGEKYKTKFLAHRHLYDTVIKAGLKNGLKYGSKAFLISGTFMFASQSISVYRNKSTPFEYGAAGALVLGVWRSYYGLKGMVAGGIIGGFCGLALGVAFYGVLKASGMTQEQRRIQFLQEEMERRYAWTNRHQESSS